MRDTSVMRAFGVHFPNGSGDYDKIARLPGSTFLVLATEARYHWRRLVDNRPGATWIWRAMPRVGRRPAELGYDPRRVAEECANLWDEQPHGAYERFLALCENDLNYERGDSEDDEQGLDERYARLANLHAEMVPHLRRILGSVELHYQAWAGPSSLRDPLQYLHRWKWAAERYDVIHVHAYGLATDIVARVRTYRSLFPRHPVVLSEWWTYPELGIEEARRCLELLRDLAAEDPLFWGACWFIWHWYDGWSDDFNIDDNPAREALFTEGVRELAEVSSPPTPAPAPTRPSFAALAQQQQRHPAPVRR